MVVNAELKESLSRCETTPNRTASRLSQQPQKDTSGRQFKSPETWIINLEFKVDRKLLLQRELPTTLRNAKWWKAVHGDTVKHPDWWKAGNGAWGCYRSHVQILEKAYNDNLECYLVLEDDAIFRDDFDELFEQYWNALPSDWEMAYIGGQLLDETKHPPAKINDHVYAPYNVNRTHGFMVHKRGYQKLYHHLHKIPFAGKDHIDHHLGRLHESREIKVYCPAKWLVGQRGGSSNISGRVFPDQWWVDPEKYASPVQLIDNPVVVFLEGPDELAELLQDRGWHQGFHKFEGYDSTVCKAVSSRNSTHYLKEWYGWVAREVVFHDMKIPCLFHPRLTLEMVQDANLGKLIHIQAQTVDEAESALERELAE